MTFIIIFCLSVKGPVSLCPFNLSSSFLLSLQYLFKFVTLLYHYSMLLGGYSTSINFLLIILFILCLNFSTSSLLLYPLSFATFLNSNKISSIVLFSYFTFFNSTTFIVSSSPPPNSFFKSARNSPIIAYFNVSAFRSSKTFFFQISADPPCIYDNTY